jgi:hypothetical protein
VSQPLASLAASSPRLLPSRALGVTSNSVAAGLGLSHVLAGRRARSHLIPPGPSSRVETVTAWRSQGVAARGCPHHGAVATLREL